MKFVNLIKKAFRALSERQILPIFLLYFITSAAFLVFFAQMFFEREKYFIFDRDAFVVRDLEQGLQNRLRIAGKINDGDFDDIEAFAINLKTGEEIEDDFEPRDGMPRRYKDGLDSVVQFYLKNGQGEEEYYVAVKVADPEFAILMLKLKIIFFSFIILLAILIIAYFIIRLSLRPLYRRIDFLNGFIRDTTHEINTPLSVISMSIETADRDNLNERNLKRFNNISLAAKSLNNIYDALVHLSFNLNKPGKKEPIDLNLLTTQRLNYFSPFFAKRGLKIDAILKPSFINADIEDVSKILDNLLSNASKYAAPNSKVSIILEPNFFSISNTGRGISKEQQMKIFDRYTRFNDDQGGFGIGLNLVKECCKKNGITVKCQSELDGETTFSLSWQS